MHIEKRQNKVLYHFMVMVLSFLFSLMSETQNIFGTIIVDISEPYGH